MFIVNPKIPQIQSQTHLNGNKQKSWIGNNFCKCCSWSHLGKHYPMKILVFFCLRLRVLFLHFWIVMSVLTLTISLHRNKQIKKAYKNNDTVSANGKININKTHTHTHTPPPKTIDVIIIFEYNNLSDDMAYKVNLNITFSLLFYGQSFDELSILQYLAFDCAVRYLCGGRICTWMRICANRNDII